MQSGRIATLSLAAADRLDAMAITNRTVKLMRDWVDGPLSAEYSMGPTGTTAGAPAVRSMR